MQNLENLDVFEILITQKLLKCPKDPFVRSALIYNFRLNFFAYLILYTYYTTLENLNELVHEISNNVVCVTSNAQTSLRICAD